MLILSRRVGETIIVGDDITITVLGLKGGQARLGIGAPRQVAIHREEIYQRKNAGASDGMPNGGASKEVAA